MTDRNRILSATFALCIAIFVIFAFINEPVAPYEWPIPMRFFWAVIEIFVLIIGTTRWLDGKDY